MEPEKKKNKWKERLTLIGLIQDNHITNYKDQCKFFEEIEQIKKNIEESKTKQFRILIGVK